MTTADGSGLVTQVSKEYSSDGPQGPGYYTKNAEYYHGQLTTETVAFQRALDSDVSSITRKTLENGADGQPVYTYKDLLNKPAGDLTPDITVHESSTEPSDPLGALIKQLEAKELAKEELGIATTAEAASLTLDNGDRLTVNTATSGASTASVTADEGSGANNPASGYTDMRYTNPAYTTATSATAFNRADGAKGYVFSYQNGVSMTETMDASGKVTYTSTEVTTEGGKQVTTVRSVWTDREGNPITSGDGTPVVGGLFNPNLAAPVANSVEEAVRGAAQQIAAERAEVARQAAVAQQVAAAEAARVEAAAEAARLAAAALEQALHIGSSGSHGYTTYGGGYNGYAGSDNGGGDPSGHSFAPVLIDMDGNGVDIISRDASHVTVDIDGSGYSKHTAWIGPHDALLVEDINADGNIVGLEIAFANRTSAADTDLQALMSLHDTNHDGIISAADTGIQNLRLWVDANSDGIAQAGELKTLTQAGLVSISGQRRLVNYTGGDADISAMSTATFVVNGKNVQRVVADVSFDLDNRGYKVLGANLNGSRSVATSDGKTLVQAAQDTALNVTLSAQQDGALGSMRADHISATKSSWIDGGAGDDVINGSAGEDWLRGGTGNDSIGGGDGNDTLVIDAQDDVRFVQGGKGFDTVIVEGPKGVTLDLSRSTIEAAYGGDGNDILTTSGPGAVVMFGGAGNDSLSGGAGADILQGQDGNDTVIGGAGNDTISGGEGNDALYGGEGDDSITIDAQDDLRFVQGGNGVDTLIFEGPGNLALDVAQASVEVIHGGAGSDTFSNSGTTAVTMYGGAGNDTLSGGVGNDTLVGGSGSDTFRSGGGNDTFVLGLGDGQDTVLRTAGANGFATIKLTDSALPVDVTTERKGDDLLIGIKGALDPLTVKDFFLTDGEQRNRVQYLEFASGARWNLDAEYVAYSVGLGAASPWSGGGNQSGTPALTTVRDGDVFTATVTPDPERVKAALRAFYNEVNLNPVLALPAFTRIYELDEDIQLKIKVTDLLSGMPGMSLVSVQDARRGLVSRDTNGDVLFSPTVNQSGTAYFTYTARDSTGKQSTGMVWLTIAEVNDAPVAVADSFSTLEDTPITLSAVQLLANDSDADIANNINERLRVSAVGNAQHGSVQLVNGQVVFNAAADYQGIASFDYTVSDVAGASSTATASVTVVGVNDAPVAAGKVAKLLAKPDTLLRIEAQTLLSYVRDADIVYGDAVRLSSIVSISSGKAWQQKDGSVLFKAGALGDVTLTVQVSDSQGVVVVVPITISVAADNNASVALLPGPDQASEDTAVRIASTQTILGVVSTLNGATTLDSNGTLVFAPTANYNGAAQVVYTVRNADNSTQQKTLDFAVAAVNDAPVVVRQLAMQTMAEDGVLTLTTATLLATVDDVDIRTNGQKLRISSVGDATNGVVKLGANGDVVFNPNKDFNGNAVFRYWVMDDAGASVGAWANVTVTPVNDTPTPLAQSISMLEDEARTFSTAALIANAALVDVDTVTNGDVLKIKSVVMAAGSEQKGTVTLDASGNVRFTPTANYNGQAAFTYTVSDSAGATGSNTMTLNISPVNDAPIALTNNLVLSSGTEDTVKTISFADLAKNFTDVDGDALTVRSVTSSYGGQATIQNGQVVFTPTKDFAGNGSFSFSVSDPSGASATSSATVKFTNINDAPIAAYKRIDGRALEDVQLRVNFSELTSGAYDADGDPVTIQSVTPVSNGNAWIDWAAQQVVFQGVSNFNGVARFNYTLADPSGATSTQAVDVGVIAVNDNPTIRAVTGFNVAEDGFYSNNQDPNANSWVRISNFLGNVAAADVDGNPLSFDEFWGTSHIAGVQRDGGDLLVQFEHNFSGTASFNYRVRDNQGGLADGQMQFNVAAQNDRPWLVGLDGWPGRGANLGGNFSARIYGSDIDSSNYAIKAVVGSNPIHGDLTMKVGQYGQDYDPGGYKSLGHGAIPPSWDIAYASHYGDEFSGRVGMNIDVSDGSGGWARQYIETYHAGSRASHGGKPVAIDLNGDGISYKNLDDSKVLFDINGDGVKDLLAWTSADDGLIVFDKNGDGIIQDLDEVSFLSYLTGSMTDLEGLNGFDTNKDGTLTAADALWSKFGVWQDKNQDGVTDAGEFKGLEAWNIRSIDLTSDQRMDQVGDVYIMGKSTFERTDGTKGEIADTAFRYIDGADTSGNTKPKTFNIDIEGVIRKRLEDAHNHGASDDDLRSMLQKFIADVASAGNKPVDVAASDAVAWSQAMYADPVLAEQLIQQQHITA